MNVRIEEVPSHAKWDALIKDMSSSSAYHRSGWLASASRASGYRCHQLVASEDGQPVAALPVFRANQKGLRVVLSPPPRLGIEYMGPVVADSLLTALDRELERLRALEAILHAVALSHRPALAYFRMVPEMTDARPLTWSGYRVGALYTYILKIPAKPDELLSQFHPSLRRGILRNESKVDVRCGGRETCQRVREFVDARFRAHGLTFGPTGDYLAELYESLGPGHFQPIEAVTDNGLEAAAIVTFHGQRASFWQHAAATASSRLPLTALMIWYAVGLARLRSCSELEIVGANTRRLVEYKSKFRPMLVPFFEAERATLAGKWAATVYRRFLGGAKG